jgi:RNA polymerase sigma-70 factor, ECF subfamily
MDSAVLEDITESLAEVSQPEEQANHDPDFALVEATRAGDVSAFEELVRLYDTRLLRIAQQVTNNFEDAQEAVQETFLKVYQKLHQFQGNSKFSTWLIRIALNESYMKLRKRRFNEVSIDDDDSEHDHLPLDLADWSPNPEQRCSQAELRRILRKALENLPPSLRVVFVLRDVEGISTKEACSILELQPSALKARLFRARLQLRERLSRHFRVPKDAEYH